MFDNLDRKWSEEYLAEKGSEIARQQLLAKKKLEDAYSQLGWRETTRGYQPNSMFFGRKVEGKVEPRGVGIGILFKDTVYEYLGNSQDRKWDRIVSVRIDSHNGVTITGFNQRQVSLKDIKQFDDVLEQAIHSPATTVPVVEWRRSSGGYSSEKSGPCLPGNSLISVSNGFVPIKSLKSGDLVWTVDKFRNRIQAVIVQKTKRLVSKNHKMAHIVLEDGRELIVSPGHPTIDNKELGSLKVGQFLDQSEIISLRIISYKEKYTYDILPSGDTGGYWANNILIRSTLSNQFKNTQWYRQLFV